MIMYDVRLQEARLALLEDQADFRFVKMNPIDREDIAELLAREN